MFVRYHEGMEKEGLRAIVARLDIQMSPLCSEMNKLHIKADKIDADQRRTMVLFEDTDGKFKLTLDAYIGLNKKMEHIEADVQDLKGRVSSLEVRITNLETLVKDGFELLSRKMDQLVRPAA